MASVRQSTLQARRRRRIWSFGAARFDEAHWSLSVDGLAMPLEAKPLAVLHELLLHAGETLTRAELLDAVWDERLEPVGDASLATAVSKLRRALGDSRSDMIVTVPTVGYRLDVPVTVERAVETALPRMAFKPGELVPGRPQWRLVEDLSRSRTADLWRARNISTSEPRIFRFADTQQGLLALKHEAAIARRLAEAPGAASYFATVLETSFESPPFFTEAADAGLGLDQWLELLGGPAEVPLTKRIEIVAAVAEALSVAHGLGVLHAGIAPEKIVIDRHGLVRLIGFENGRLFWDAEGERIDENTEPEAISNPYRAPELADGQPETIASDVFSLGVVLFQAVAGDFTRPLTIGWESDVEDQLVADDIAAAASGDPRRRMKSAAELAGRLLNLSERRQDAAAAEAECQRLVDQAERDRRRRVRAPWVRAAAVIGVVGLLTTSAASIVAVRSRNIALQERGTATAAYDFLSDDLLARVSPARADAAEETLTEAVLRARGEIDRRFADQPLVAARLHRSLAGALHQRSQWEEARRSFWLADAAFRRAGAQSEPEAAENRMSLAATEAASGPPGSLERAKRLVAAERTRNPQASSGPAGVKLLQAEGLIAYFGDPTLAPEKFTKAADLADALPEQYTPVQRLQLRQSAAMALLRNGDAAQAEPILRRTANRLAALVGADHPDALLARGSALTAASSRGRNAEVLPRITELLPLMERRFGPDHRYTLAMLSLRSQALTGLGRLKEAARDADRVWRGSLAREGPGQQAQVAELELAGLLCRDGRETEGTRHARVARAAVEDGVGASHPLAHTAAFVLGECLVASGEPGQALQLFETVDPVLAGQQVADANWAPTLHLARAEAHLAVGDRASAGSEAAAIGSAFESSQADEYERKRVIRLRRSLAETAEDSRS